MGGSGPKRDSGQSGEGENSLSRLWKYSRQCSWLSAAPASMSGLQVKHATVDLPSQHGCYSARLAEGLAWIRNS